GMTAKNVSDDNFDKSESIISANIPKSQNKDCFRAYFMAHAKASSAKRKHNSSSRDFTLFTTSVCMGWITKRTVTKKGKNQWLCLNSVRKILYKSMQVNI